MDPADAQRVFNFAQSKGLKLTRILCTHAHWDHAGGNADMQKLGNLLRQPLPGDMQFYTE